MTARLLTWNIWGRFGNWRAREKAILATLTALHPDVVALQETWREPGISQASILAAELGCEHVESHPTVDLGLAAGLAILSHWPIRSANSVNLPDGGAPSEHRRVLRAHIATPTGLLAMHTTHLNSRPDHSHIRQAQVRHLLQYVEKAERLPLPPIFCGDFNAIPVAEEIRMLTGRASVPVSDLVFQDAWEVGGDESPGYTWSYRNPEAAKWRTGNCRIDYVFVGWQPGPGRILHAKVIEGDRPENVWPSDHFGLLVEIDL
jgi:endonuclease/exonuclease/phosphatase family metal-dependent hydrolase